MIRLKDCLLAACLLSPLTQAADIGHRGELWPVRAPDLLPLTKPRPKPLQSTGQREPPK
ncbi:conjugal transfer protein TraW, partial [Escherichia coli]|nr:conjugal transfer protein TraW [Escherichia coli]